MIEIDLVVELLLHSPCTRFLGHRILSACYLLPFHYLGFVVEHLPTTAVSLLAERYAGALNTYIRRPQAGPIHAM